MHWATLASALTPTLMMLVIVAGGTLLEYAFPAEPNQPPQHTLFNVVYGVTLGGLRFALAPILGIGVTLILNRFGTGWIVLPSHGWALIGSVLAYVTLVDFLEFAFHRAQHAVPFL